jgi:CubicO group peptidase (beta-lactamase class C family)
MVVSMASTYRLTLFLLLFLFISHSAFTDENDCCAKRTPAKTTASAEELQKFIRSIVPDLMRGEHIPGAVFVYVQNGKMISNEGFGYANLETKQPVEPGKTIFPIGSISKVFTATALIQLADRQKIDLNADINSYLKKLKVPEAFGQPIKGAQLLSHTAGFDEIRPGTQAGSPSAILPLHQFLKNRLVRVDPPGVITSYSTYGITLAGLLVEELSGVSYETYLNRNIWKPLEMNRTHISTPPHLAASVAIPYGVEKDTPVKVDYEWYHTLPASSIRSTAEEMANFMIAQLECGNFHSRQILSARAACEMHRTQSTTHPEMPGWTYGFQEDDTNGLRILEHGGDIAGFSSLIVLLPDENAGFFVAHHVEGGNLRFDVKQKLLDRYFPDKRPVKVPVPAPDSTGRLKRFAGRYRANLFCHTCKNPLPVAEVEVTSNTDGTITVWDDRWVQTKPLLFVRLDGKRKIGFQQDKSGRILQMSAGSWKVLEKVK